MSNLRTVTFFSTKGLQKAKIETDVTLWKELAVLATQNGYDLDKLHATESVTKTDLVHPEALLPVGNFVLFLRPKKTKSGLEVAGLSFTQLRGIVSELKGYPAFIEHINAKGNYTRLDTESLRAQLSSWTGAVEETKAEEIKIVETEEIVFDKVDISASVLVRLQKVSDSLEEIGEELDNSKIDKSLTKINRQLTKIELIVNKLFPPVPTAKDIAREAEKTENSQLAQEAADLCREIGC